MSYEYDALSPIIVDVESAPLPNASTYFDPVEADKRLTDPAKIIADIHRKEEAQHDKAALDWNCARIVALGWWHSGRERTIASEKVIVRICKDERDEAAWLTDFWEETSERTIVGFCIKTFDLPLLIQRSRYLNVPYPAIDIGRYARSHRVVDLYDLLTFNNVQDTYVMKRTVQNFAKRFGIPVTDQIKGEDVPRLIAEGNWQAVADHCRSDVELELALARRLGVVPQPTPEPVP